MTKIITLLLLLISLNAGADEATYKQGTEDGCQSGKNDILNPFKKDIDKYVKDEYYKAGWQDGFRICKAQYDSIKESMSITGW